MLSFPRQLYAKLLFWASRLRSCGVGAGGEGAVDAWKSGADGRWKSGKKRRKEEIGRGAGKGEPNDKTDPVCKRLVG